MTKEDFVVSVIIPVYNVSAYIERCIRSVISQTYGNIKCIIVDDASYDNSIIQCEQIMSKIAFRRRLFLHAMEVGTSVRRKVKSIGNKY